MSGEPSTNWRPIGDAPRFRHIIVWTVCATSGVGWATEAQYDVLRRAWISYSDGLVEPTHWLDDKESLHDH